MVMIDITGDDGNKNTSKNSSNTTLASSSSSSNNNNDNTLSSPSSTTLFHYRVRKSFASFRAVGKGIGGAVRKHLLCPALKSQATVAVPSHLD